MGAGSCGYICMCYSEEMLSEIVIASVCSLQIGGRVTIGRDNSLYIYIFFFKDLEAFLCFAMGKAGGCRFPLRPLAVFRKSVRVV